MVTIVTISAPSSVNVGEWFNVSGIVYNSITGEPYVNAYVAIYYEGLSLGSAYTGVDGDYLDTVKINEAGTFELESIAGAARASRFITITEPEPSWEYHSTYRGIDIQVWMPNGTPYTAYFDGKWHQAAHLSTLKAAIDDFLDPEPPPGEPYTVIDDFTVPEYLPEGSDVNVRVLLKNTGEAAGYLSCVINGNPNDPSRYITVETGTTYPTSVAPGASIWLDIYFRYFKMPSWDFNLIAINYEGTSYINKTIILEAPAVGIPTTTTISAPSKAAVNEKIFISGILYETESGNPIPNQPINHSYNGKSLGSSTTGVDGDYLKEVSIPESGVWVIKSKFPGTETLQASKSQSEAVVAAPLLETVIKIAAPATIGLAIIKYSLS